MNSHSTKVELLLLFSLTQNLGQVKNRGDYSLLVGFLQLF